VVPRLEKGRFLARFDTPNSTYVRSESYIFPNPMLVYSAEMSDPGLLETAYDCQSSPAFVAQGAMSFWFMENFLCRVMRVAFSVDLFPNFLLF
jgi:hypothetical protein